MHVYHRRQHPTLDHDLLPSSSAYPVFGDPPVVSDLDIPIDLRKCKRSCMYPIASFVTYDRLSGHLRSLVSTLDSILVPKIVKEALTHSEWRVTIIEEMNALDHNDTWALMDLPKGKKEIVCKHGCRNRRLIVD